MVQFGTQTQTQGLAAQLNEGIRALDIRLREAGDTFLVMHGAEPLGNLTFVPDVLQVATDFPHKNSTETIVMKVKKETDNPGTGNRKSFDQVFQDYENQTNPATSRQYGSYIWQATPSTQVPANLGVARGKIIIVQNGWDTADSGDSVVQTVDPNFATGEKIFPPKARTTGTLLTL